MSNWRVRSLGVLEHLNRKSAEQALDFVSQRKVDILKGVAFGWGVFLLMTFTLIVTIRLALV